MDLVSGTSVYHNTLRIGTLLMIIASYLSSIGQDGSFMLGRWKALSIWFRTVAPIRFPRGSRRDVAATHRLQAPYKALPVP